MYSPGPDTLTVNDQADRPAPFTTFARLLYTWANSQLITSPLAKTLLRSLLTQLGDDALIFFISIWTGDEPLALRIGALRHATAFIQAHAGQSGADFQLVLPAILLAFVDEARSVREAGVQVLQSITTLAKTGGSNIYGLETLYGSRSSQSLYFSPSLQHKLIPLRSRAAAQAFRSPTVF